jgi:type II/III secretion system protein
LLDNNETRSLSKVPVLGDVPVLGALFKSKSFQKNETELMFFVTAQLVKPVNRDDLPQLRGVDGLKNGSPLGVEPKGEGVEGQTGYKISGQKTNATPSGPSDTTESPKPSQPKATTTTTSGSSTGATEQGSTGRVNPTLPPARLEAARLFPTERLQ